MNSVLLKRDLNLFIKAVERKRKSWRQFLAVAIQGKVVLPTNLENFGSSARASLVVEESELTLVCCQGALPGSGYLLCCSYTSSAF